MRLLRYLSRRSVLFAAATALVGRLYAPKEARADFFGGDLPLLAGILGEAIATVADLVTMINQLTQEVNAATTMLHKLDPNSAEALLNLIAKSEFSLGALTAEISSIGYTLDSVNQGFGKVYTNDYSQTHFSQFNTLYGQWQNEVLASTKVAARAQGTLSALQSYTDQAHDIVSASNAADGEIAQLQAIVQMLGVIVSQNNALLQQLTTTGRVIADVAAGTASERQLSLEKKKRNLAGYTDRGDPVPKMDRLP